MNLITYRFGLDLAKHGSQVVLSGMKVGDTNRAIDVALSVNGEPFYLGAEHVATIRTKVYTDLEMYEFEDACQIRENRVFYILAPEILYYPGEIHAELVIGTAGTEIFSTARFVFFAKGENNGEPELPENTYNSVLTALADAEFAKKKSITDAAVIEGNLVFALYDGSEKNVGNVVGPQGEKGEQGPQGERGEQGPQGERGEVDYSLVANALKGTVSGSAVAMTDVSPLEHEIQVNLSYEKAGGVYLEDLSFIGGEMESGVIYTVTGCEKNDDESELTIVFEDDSYVQFSIIDDDPKPEILQADTRIYYDSETNALYYAEMDFTAVTLTKYGNNLFDDNKEYESVITIEENGEKVFVHPGYQNPNDKYNALVGFVIDYIWDIANKLNLPVTISYDIKTAIDGQVQVYTLGKKRLNTTSASRNIPSTTEWQRYRYTTTPTYVESDSSGANCLLVFFGSPYGSGIIPFIKNLQIEIGTEETPYAKFPVQTYKPKADGTVDGVTSLYPTTTLMTDTEGVTIEAEYNRDINKAFAEIYQAIAQMGAEAVTIPEEV